MSSNNEGDNTGHYDNDSDPPVDDSELDQLYFLCMDLGIDLDKPLSLSMINKIKKYSLFQYDTETLLDRIDDVKVMYPIFAYIPSLQ